MTTDSDFKALVRARMAQTGQTYTAARAELMSTPALPTRERTADEIFWDKTIRAFFDGDRLRSIPVKRKARVVVLLELLARFEPGRRYAEREVNEVLGRAHEDFASLRRELIDYRYLERADGWYWITTQELVRDATEAQEVPTDEATYLQALRDRPRP